MNNEDIIRMLNEDFAHEIEATMVYVRNSFVMKDCDHSRLTEAISVDEMRHMWWLADLITKRGGQPIMAQRPLDFGGDTPKGQLQRQIELETAGIVKYEEQCRLIDDQEVVGVLRHIIDEEKRHRKEFRERLRKL
jgi:bacterioferritin